MLYTSLPVRQTSIPADIGIIGVDRTDHASHLWGVYTIEQTSSKYQANIELAQTGLLEPRPLAQM